MTNKDEVAISETTPTTAELYAATHLQPNLTFDTLVTGRSNKLAVAAAREVVMDPGRHYNPLFIFGGIGVGKTHLLHAVGNAAFESNQSAQIRYVQAEDFFSDVVRAFLQNSRDAFKRYYRSLDLLLVDDIQFFNRKDRTQEEFFYAFNSLVEAKKQIVITCDTYPKDAQGLGERLSSRFDWGLTVGIEPATRKMRTNILNWFAERRGIELDDEVVRFVAKKLRSNARELEGAVNRFVLDERVNGRQVTRSIARGILNRIQ
jgi:chromosomal replication initiator protein